MALINADGHYLTITDVSVTRAKVRVRCYQNQEKHDAGLSQFDQAPEDVISCPTLPRELGRNAASTRSIRENVWNAAYRALKAVAPYNDMEDV